MKKDCFMRGAPQRIGFRDYCPSLLNRWLFGS